MNWFEDDLGHWHNLDLMIELSPPGDGETGTTGEEQAICTFSNGNQIFLTDSEWLRIKSQLLNSQRPADRRQTREPELPRTSSPEPAPTADANTPKESA